MTAEELVERMRDAHPPTADDVPVTFDGRRLDSPESVGAWLADLAARRALRTSRPNPTWDPARDLPGSRPASSQRVA